MKKIFTTLLLLFTGYVVGFAQERLDFIEEASVELNPPTTGVYGAAMGWGTGVVGAIGGSIDVGGLGGATYTIPIDIPDGIAGLKPSISVVYNSQSSNGLLGWGWTLGGLSAITRVNKTLYHDGEMGGANFSGDRFALDGQRLILVNSNGYGTNGAEYRTEIDGMSKIVSYTENGIVNGPAKFKIWTADGHIMEYGYSEDSRMAEPAYDNSTNRQVGLWLLNKVEDRDGNYMEYHYVIGGANYYISYITYTGNQRINYVPCYTIHFQYEEGDRADGETTFVGNFTLHQSKLLKAISVKWWDNEVSRYDFGYYGTDAANGYYYNRLQSVTYSKGNVSYNPTIITWGSNDYGVNALELLTDVTINQPNDFAFYNKVKVTGDFNGDGFTDVIKVYKDSGNNYADLYLNCGRVTINGMEKCSFSYHQTIELDAYTVSLQVADFDGDGRDDMVSISRIPRIGPDRVRIFPFLTKWRNNRWELDYAEKGWNDDNGFSISDGHNANLMIGDFLGRGKTEMMMQIPDGHLSSPHLLYISYSGNNHFDLSDASNTVIPGNVFQAADFNGDGITEIWCNDSDLDGEIDNERSIASIYKMTSESSAVQFNTDHVYTSGHTVMTGDFNGDGHADILSYEKVSKSDRYIWKINYFESTELYYPYFDITDVLPFIDPSKHNFELMGTASSHVDYQYYEVMDMNGDGKSDFVVESNRQIYIFYGPVVRDALGNAVFSSQQVFSMNDIGLGYVTSTMTLCHGNFLGKENAGILSNSIVFSPKTMTNRYSVNSITDGMYNRVTLDYDYLTALNSSIYQCSSSLNLPNLDIYTTSLPIKAVKQISCQNLAAETPETVTKYCYENAFVHRKGHGVLGFKKATSTSYINEVRQDSTITIQSVANLEKHRTIATSSQLVYNALNRLVLKVEYDNDFIEKSNFPLVYVPIVKTKSTTAFSPDGNEQTMLSKSITDNVYHIDLESYDGGIGYYTNTLKLTDVYDGVTDYQWATHATNCRNISHTHTVFQPELYLENWIINRPDTTIVTSWHYGENVHSKSLITYSYRDDTSYHLLTVTSYPGGDISNENNLATSTSYEYDLAGNVVADTLTALGGLPSPRVNSYVYDHYRFVTEEINTFGYVSQSIFSLDYGEISRSADCNGITTFYNRSDHLGSTDWVKYPDNTFGCTAMRWAKHQYHGFYDADAPENSAYYSWKRISGELPTKVFYDAAGREIRTVSYGLFGDTIYQDVDYNNMGRVFRKSLPYYKGDVPLWTSYYYDQILRPQYTYFPDGTWIQYNYDGLSTTTVFHATTGESHTSTEIENYFGKKAKTIDDAGAEVSYTYYPNGMLRWTQIGDNENTRVTMEYDDAGNRTHLYDPNYGEIVEIYDAFGQLKTSTTPKGDETSYQYDALGRIETRKEIDNIHNAITETNWDYYENEGQKGLLKQIRYDTIQIISYIYDYVHLNRLTSKTERLFGIDYMTSYTYDDLQGFPLRVKTVTYPTGYITQNVYHASSGKLYRINDSGGNKLWETTETNSKGQITQFDLGANTSSVYGYQPETGRINGIYSHSGNSNLQILGYAYDDFGNLSVRYDKKRGLVETFGYDNLDRLDSITLNDQIISRITYDSFGRMISKQSDGQVVFANAQYDYVGSDGQLRPHAISSASVTSGSFPNAQLDVDYTMFDKVRSISRPSNPYLFDYGYDHQRIRMHDSAYYEKVYVGGCEFVNSVSGDKAWTYLVGPMGVFGVAETIGNATTVHYVLKDYLGSWTTMVSAAGISEQELSFNAWGLPRNPNNWRELGFNTDVTLMFDRGFTGHEHLQDVGLINMNGRLYDPVMSSFLSVDSYVQDPDNAQNFNRYAYCLNNPLKYIDPSGESITLLGVMAIGAAVSALSTMATNYVYDRPIYEGVAKAAVVGALQGAFSFGVGGAAALIENAVVGVSNHAWGTVAKVGFQVLAHGALGGVSTKERGGSFWSGFASGAVASFVASTTGIMVEELPKSWQVTCMVAAGSLSGGITASMAGGYFWDGVCNGLICSGLNHAMHLVVGPDDPPEKNTKNRSPNKDNKVVEGSALISGEAAIVKTAADWAAGGSRVEILNGISKWSKRIGIAGTAINVAVNVNKAVQGEISWASFAVRTVVTGVEVGIAAIPMVGPILSSMIVCYDIGGGFDNTLYNDNWIHPTKP